MSRGLRPVLAVLAALGVAWCALHQPSRAAPLAAQAGGALTQAATGTQQRVTGRVERILADDRDGSPHQRFIIRIQSGTTLLIAHNIELAPRLDGLAVGDTVEVYGEYVWNDKGGLIHWTHRDPAGNHAAGYIEWRGRRFQ